MVQLEEVYRKVSDYFAIDYEHVVSKSRKHIYVKPRSVASYIAYEYFNFKLKEISKFLNLDHTSVVHQRDAIQGYIDIEMYGIKKDIANLLVLLDYNLVSGTTLIASNAKRGQKKWMIDIFEKKFLPMEEMIKRIKLIVPIKLREPYANLQTPIPYPSATGEV